MPCSKTAAFPASPPSLSLWASFQSTRPEKIPKTTRPPRGCDFSASGVFRGFLWSVAERDFDGAGVLDQLAAWIDAAHFVDGFGDGNGAGGVVFVANHRAEFSFFEELDGFDAEARAEYAVEHRGCASALKMAEHASAHFLAGAITYFLPDELGDSSESVVARWGMESGNPAILRFCSFGDDDHRALGAFPLAAQNLFGDFGKFKGNLGNENNVRAARETAVEGDPAGMATHDFDHHHALVARCRRVKAVERTRHALHCGVEAECHVRGLQIVVDRFWNSCHWQPRIVQLQGCIQRTVAADNDEAMQVERLKGLPSFSKDFCWDERALAAVAA